ncbi:hypothetical protein TCAL_13280 [Tigriopus californicus]|uniref:Chitin-binding type-2 domain-containing protein n=1 Tax=Tigriopus californicus TaxID=6832 RepID=A0A553NDL2_TIGCA|nr:protein obstructor-E-like [Tigriopus californicus]TRY63544.1 hypothetical protein TCAL_13280 [Tigriopus californicus]
MKELVIIFLFAISAAIKVELTDYVCEEPHGYFPDPEQCDLYYECKNGVATPKLCPDGLLFLLGEAISVKCDYPFNIDCGSREFVQEPEPNIDPKCYRANGYFNHEDATVCDRFYNCVNGVAYELPCAAGLIFDEAIGTCVREEQASSYAKRCVKSSEKANIDGFLCPEEETIGPHGQPLAHPRFPHPKSCQRFITCYFGKDIRELGCGEGEVFDDRTTKCVLPKDGPLDCSCWYNCKEDSACPENCRSDCSCPVL